MKVAIFHPWIYLKGGAERTILELVMRSRHDWTIFTGKYAPEDTFDEFRDLNVVEAFPLSVVRRVGPVARACFKLLAHQPNWSEYDAVVISCEGIGNLLALRAHGAPLICLCHTPLKVAYDEHTSARWRAVHRPGMLARIGVRLFAFADRFTWRRYERVFCVSNEVRRRLLSKNVVAPERTEVLQPGVDLARFTPSGRTEPFFLLPGRIMWTKNVELGIDAFMRMKGEDAAGGPRLVIAGAVDEKSKGYLAQLRRLAGDRRDIEFVISPADEELLDLYDRCLAVLFTPPNEDWGLVPLEAMAFGKPVIAVDQGGPRESVLHGETGFRCAPDASEFAQAMRTLWDDPALASAMSQASLDRAPHYDWSRFVERFDAYIEELAGVPERDLELSVAR